MKIVEKIRSVLSDREFKSALRGYLVRSAEARNEPWRSRRALLRTVDDVLALDADLLGYVRAFVEDESQFETDLGCEVASVAELLAAGHTPVQAAMLVQWYRRKPQEAAAFLVQHDKVTAIALPPDEADAGEAGASDSLL